MANSAAIVATSRTPYSAVLQASNDGTPAAPFAYTRTNLLAALLPGPLRALLTKTADWSVFNAGGGAQSNKLRISSVFGGTSSDIDYADCSTNVIWAADELQLMCNTVAPSTARVFYIELRCEMSNER